MGGRILRVSAFAFLMLLPALAEAARPPQNGRKPVKVAATVQDYPSRNFLIHTDLSKAEANDLKQRLEAMLHMISSYWGTPSKGVIEICVVKDLANWPPEYQAKMEPRGIAKIQEGAGVCIGRTATRGRMWVGKAYVYAAAEHRGDKGVPLHESVHGYCDQAFGRCGPRWYAEGMAEMGHYWVAGVRGVNTLPHVLKYLRTCEPRKLESLIVSDDQLGGKWEDYCWWWFLCFFLDNNNNYSAQFRALGRHILSGQKTTFQEVFGAQAKEMDFEFRFALQHLEQGLRIDLLTWDWKRKFVSNLTPGQRLSAIVHADYGWQPSSLTVKAGTTYEYRAKDTWSAGKDAKSVDADGAANGRGRLVGVLMKDYQLSEEFELGKSGSFTPAIDGDLYLRCRAPWAKISGNSGRMTVYLRRKPAEAKTGDGK